MAAPTRSLEVPYRDKVIDIAGLISMKWQFFYRDLMDLVKPLGTEKQFTIVNSTASAADVDGLVFSERGVSVAYIDFLVQRITDDPVELVEAGHLIAVYNPTSEDWSLVEVSVDNPDNSGVTFSITAAGQVQYTSSNIAGTASISRVVWRARTMQAKSSEYSAIGVKY